MAKHLVPLILLMYLTLPSLGQPINNQSFITINKQGELFDTRTKQPVYFFGTNYTLPFAHAYRAHERLGINHEQAIQNDVYHFHRLGFNAFRVHVWDVEISDTAGNLLQNEHLRLFDFLIAELKKYNISIMLTPIAFWGNGYPERDEATPGFATGIHKRYVLREEEKIKAQENYIGQLTRHINTYTGLSYAGDPSIIVMEINNEPHHTGEPSLTTNYINRMVAAAKKAGWKKPVFYNISESPSYGEAVLKANINGVSFQWYPTGLVAGSSLQGNFYPNMTHYHVPWQYHPAMKNKAKMVYEFDAGDLMSNYAFPTMAASFKNAGMQWATHFAYDPLAMAPVNTEYQTHYVNLAYTPSKAISLLIAAKFFTSNVFYNPLAEEVSAGPLTINAIKDHSEWNDDTSFYHTSTTFSNAVNPAGLKHIAGTGSSPLIQYKGTGAYFFDKVNDDSWRLELMPDAIAIKDPFERASPHKTVTRIVWKEYEMKVSLAALGNEFHIKGINKNNNYYSSTNNGSFKISPGTYLLTKKEAVPATAFSNIPVNFVAPKENIQGIEVRHQQPLLLAENKKATLSFIIAGISQTESIVVEVLPSAGRRQSVSAINKEGYKYEAVLPAEWLVNGILQYRLLISSSDSTIAFPGSIKGNPYSWSYTGAEFWESTILPEEASIPLFRADEKDYRERILLYQPDWRHGSVRYHSDSAARINLKISYTDSSEVTRFGFEHFIGDIVKTFKRRPAEMITISGSYTNIDSLIIQLADASGAGYSAVIASPGNIESISLYEFKPSSIVLLPRPYPSFQPLEFSLTGKLPVSFHQIEKIQVLATGTALKEKSMQISEVIIR